MFILDFLSDAYYIILGLCVLWLFSKLPYDHSWDDD